MKILGIECTAHTLSIGISENGRILSNVIDTYSGGAEGLVPRKMADHHSDVFAAVWRKSLAAAGLAMDEVSLIAFSQGPGIGAPLSVGISGAKYLASRFRKELIGVNHGYAHAKISEHFCKMEHPLVLYVSGGNSQILVEKEGYYHVLGETLDIGIGNLFDNVARALKLEHAHGSALSKLAEGGSYVDLPYSVKGMNLCFSGLQTAAEKAALKESRNDVAYSVMETAFAMSCEVAERALFLTGKKKLVVCGGVAQNRRLQAMLKTMCDEDGVEFGVAPDEYNRDNGAMIAYAGGLLYKKYGAMESSRCYPVTNYRIDRMKEVLG
ncbi:MAG TPA: tRNA (adenosine(37)-N6)-threonylcarbamoyltransferase complex transferase subunit TsaD [Candidatus Bilamarchaeum sp.]|nr:tRNA (adenosine(37)-N6)-threonylcarbamoyltransferase complex transferase subunit TsaD [Candidatus Bilamarchaeum sp.]